PVETIPDGASRNRLEPDPSRAIPVSVIVLESDGICFWTRVSSLVLARAVDREKRHLKRCSLQSAVLDDRRIGWWPACRPPRNVLDRHVWRWPEMLLGRWHRRARAE